MREKKILRVAETGQDVNLGFDHPIFLFTAFTSLYPNQARYDFGLNGMACQNKLLLLVIQRASPGAIKEAKNGTQS